MYIELKPTVIFHPQDIKKEIRKLQEEYGDEITALISRQVYIELHEAYPDTFRNYGNEDMISHISITKYENEKGTIDFIVAQ